MAHVHVENIVKRFGQFTAVDGVSLDIPSGCVYGLLGPNGAGKTSTIRMIMNIFLPDSGEIRIDGRPVDEAVKRGIGYLPEERGLYRKMRVGEHLEYLARLKGLSSRDAARRTGEFLERLELSSWRMKRVEDLSKGMQQKIQFAAALIHLPSLVILDEPFSGLDPLNAQLLVDWMADLRREGVTILLSTHQMATAEQLCDSIAIIHRGRVLAEGLLEKVRADHAPPRYKIEFEGETAFEPRTEGVCNAQPTDKGWLVELRPGSDTQALLSSAMEAGKVRAFHAVEPTLQEIFVDMVREAGMPEPEPEPEEEATFA